jgi:Uma2 family endonuclease
MRVATTCTAVRYPDVLVICSPFDRDAMTSPGIVVVIEVVSSGNSRTDRTLKIRECAAVPSIRP